jgi:3-dehydroquinate synthase
MTEIKVEIKPQDNDYKIFIGYNILTEIRKFIDKYFSKKRIVLLCDSNIKKIYKDIITGDLEISKNNIFVFPKGESSKSTKMKEKIETDFLNHEVDRNSLLLTFGGGVTGDLGGFIAATYYRGIPFIQIPTSLLAMVDSSIGGKVAVNHNMGKNLIGAFYQPKAVFIDTKTLETLPQKEYINGFSEIIKTALIRDKKYFIFLKENLELILKRDINIVQKMIKRSCEIKAEVVSLDEKEGGLRKILNYGHTIGHAIEKLSNYKIHHGFAVSIGMNIENRIAESQGLISSMERKEIEEFIIRSGLPVKIPKNIQPDDIIKKLKYDKKSVSGIPRFSILKGIGNCLFDIEVDKTVIKSSLNNQIL